MDLALEAFADEVGDAGPVTVVGGRTQWTVGGAVRPDAREVKAPAGVVEYEPAEMTVRVRAGTLVGDLQNALASAGQRTVLPDRPDSTVGGVLAVGRSDIYRLGRGPVRDTALEVTYVSAEGRLVKAGGPTVKNVSGFDLCRLMVGAVGTLGCLAEVVLRTQPLPKASVWLEGEADPNELRSSLYWPTSILWDGTRCWVHLEGQTVDVEDQGRVAASLGVATESSPPPLPPHRVSLRPSELGSLTGSFVAEVGVGLAHVAEAPGRPAPDPQVDDLNRRVKLRFDPTGRLNPGRRPCAAGD